MCQRNIYYFLYFFSQCRKIEINANYIILPRLKKKILIDFEKKKKRIMNISDRIRLKILLHVAIECTLFVGPTQIRLALGIAAYQRRDATRD